MKKIFGVLGVATAMLFFCNEKAQAQYGGQGQIDINVGVGLGSFLSGTGYKTTVPPISASADYGINDNISVGGYVGYSAAEFDQILWKTSVTYLVVGARGAYHKELVDGIDTYGGVMLGYNIANLTMDPDPGPPFNDIKAGGVMYGVFAGARYYFTDNIGAHLELGYGIAIAQLGLSIKL